MYNLSVDGTKMKRRIEELENTVKELSRLVKPHLRHKHSKQHPTKKEKEGEFEAVDDDEECKDSSSSYSEPHGTGGIVDILDRKSDYVTALTGKNIEVRKICVRDASKPRDFDLPDHASIVTNFDDILDDPEIDMVVEVMGGTTAAKDVIFSALKNGKDVVTANKALIAQDLTEIESLVGEVNKGLESGDEVEFRYEAAVCGGIPIIRSLQSDFVGDSISCLLYTSPSPRDRG